VLERHGTLLLAYAFWRQPPSSMVLFRRLAGMYGHLSPITAACFLLYRHPDQPCVYDFVLETAPTLVHQLSRTTQRQRVELHGRVRGRIDWSSTYKARYAEDGNPALFVCSQSWRRFDRPENQLFKFMLGEIRGCLDRALPVLQAWQAWGAHLGDERPLSVGMHLARLAHRLRPLRSHIYLRDIQLPARISGRHLAAAETSKNELYAMLAPLYRLYADVVGVESWVTWSETLAATLPLPPAAGEFGRLLALTPGRG
jgi:hypothetical protein